MPSFHLNDAILGNVSELFAALGDASRLKLLRALLEAEEPLCQSRLVETTGLSQANASKHLGFLVRAGLVERHPRGTQVYFSAVLPLVSLLCDLVCDHVTARVQKAYQSIS